MKLAPAPPQYDPADQARVRAEIERADAQNVKRGVAAPFLLLGIYNKLVKLLGSD